MNKPVKMEPGVKLRDAAKMALIPVKVLPTEKNEMLRKPEWLKIRLPKSTERIEGIKQAMRKHGLHSVCEEASCPNLSECFNHGTATFMILGAICTRRCPFCDVAHGRPLTPDATEPEKLALTIKDMKLSYVVITSVDRDSSHLILRERHVWQPERVRRWTGFGLPGGLFLGMRMDSDWLYWGEMR